MQLFKVSECRVKVKRREVWELLNMESGEACFGLVCVRGSPHNRRWDSFSPVDRKWKVGWLVWPRSGNLLLSLHEVQGGSVEVLSVGKV